MLNRIPTAWLQLRYQKVRLIVALAGVIFAVLIVFMQLGIRNALFDSATLFHESLKGDCFLISPRSTALISMESFSQRRLLQTLAFPEVDFVDPIYLGFAQWRNPQHRSYWRSIFVIGFDLEHSILDLSEVEENLDSLKTPDVVLFDRDSMSQFGPIASEFQQQGSVTTEIGFSGNTRKVEVAGLFKLGTSFSADGNLITSDLNFFRIFNRDQSAIDVGLIKLKPGTNIEQFTQSLKQYLPSDVEVLSKSEFIALEKEYWQSSTSIGFIFSLGVFLGIIVGIVVVYQILYTNISEHLPEYATLKAIGYRHKYLLSIVLQQAIFIAILGYIPGFISSILLYEFVKQGTGLPISMSVGRATFVLLSTIIMCFVSGLSAVFKLSAADPADVF